MKVIEARFIQAGFFIGAAIEYLLHGNPPEN
jgi:hypothetical protein